MRRSWQPCAASSKPWKPRLSSRTWIDNNRGPIVARSPVKGFELVQGDCVMPVRTRYRDRPAERERRRVRMLIYHNLHHKHSALRYSRQSFPCWVIGPDPCAIWSCSRFFRNLGALYRASHPQGSPIIDLGLRQALVVACAQPLYDRFGCLPRDAQWGSSN